MVASGDLEKEHLASWYLKLLVSAKWWFGRSIEKSLTPAFQDHPFIIWSELCCWCETDRWVHSSSHLQFRAAFHPQSLRFRLRSYIDQHIEQDKSLEAKSPSIFSRFSLSLHLNLYFVLQTRFGTLYSEWPLMHAYSINECLHFHRLFSSSFQVFLIDRATESLDCCWIFTLIIAFWHFLRKFAELFLVQRYSYGFVILEL